MNLGGGVFYLFIYLLAYFVCGCSAGLSFLYTFWVHILSSGLLSSSVYLLGISARLSFFLYFFLSFLYFSSLLSPLGWNSMVRSAHMYMYMYFLESLDNGSRWRLPSGRRHHSTTACTVLDNNNFFFPPRTKQNLKQKTSQPCFRSGNDDHAVSLARALI